MVWYSVDSSMLADKLTFKYVIGWLMRDPSGIVVTNLHCRPPGLCASLHLSPDCAAAKPGFTWQGYAFRNQARAPGENPRPSVSTTATSCVVTLLGASSWSLGISCACSSAFGGKFGTPCSFFSYL